jgi:hypothetical protein
MEQIVAKLRESMLITREKFEKELVSLLELLRAQSQLMTAKRFLQARQKYEQQLVEMSALAGEFRSRRRSCTPNSRKLRPDIDEKKAWGSVRTSPRLCSPGSASVQRSLAAKGLSPFVDLSVGLRVRQDSPLPSPMRGPERFSSAPC